jgi:hypothetical protein
MWQLVLFSVQFSIHTQRGKSESERERERERLRPDFFFVLRVLADEEEITHSQVLIVLFQKSSVVNATVK